MLARFSQPSAKESSGAIRRQTLLLLLPLIAALSGPAAAFAADLVDLESSFLGDARELSERFESALRQARAQGTPGTSVGPVRPADVQALEASLQSARTQAQSLINLPTTAPAGGGRFLPTELKQQVIANYLELLSSAVSLRIALRWDHSSAWRDGLGLRISASQLADFSEMASIATGRRGELFSTVIIDRTNDPATMRLSDSYVEGLEVGALSDQTGSDAALLLLVKYLTIRQLQDNLELTQRLQKKTPNVSSTFPAELTRALPTLGLSETVFAQRRSILKAAAFSAALAKAITEQASKLPTFADAVTAQKLADTIARAVTSDSARAKTYAQDLAAPLQAVFQEAQSAKWAEVLEDELRATDPAAIERGDETGVLQLRAAISGALANTQQRKLLELIQSGALQLPTAAKIQLLTVIADRQKQIQSALSSSLTGAILASAKQKATYEVTEGPRARFLDEITLGARETSAKLKALQAGTTLDFAALYKVLTPRIQTLLIDETRTTRPRLNAWLKELESAPTWTEARIRYTALFANELNASALHEGQVEKARALAIINSEGVVPQLELPPVISAEYRAHVIDTVAAHLRADWKTLIRVGDLFGFNWTSTPSSTEPSPSKFLTDSSSRSAYQAALTRSLQDRFPVLAETVIVGSHLVADEPSGTTRTVQDTSMLASAISEIVADDTLDETGLDRLESLVDQALAKVESRIRKNIGKVGAATSLKALEPLLASELQFSQLLGIFPEFGHQFGKSLELMSRPSTAEVLLHESTGTHMTVGFTALMLLHLGARFIKPAAPFFMAASYGVEPLVAGYMRAATFVLLGDAVYQGYQISRMHQSTNLIADFYGSTPAAAWTGSWFGIGEVEAARSSYRVALAFYVGRLAIEVPFMYWPLFKEIRFARGGSWNPKDFSDLYASERSDFLMDVDAFRVMGVTPGDWQAINATSFGKRFMQANGSEAAERVIRLAYARLRAKIAAGKTWVVVDEAGYQMTRPGTANYRWTAAETRLLSAFKRLTGGGSK